MRGRPQALGRGDGLPAFTTAGSDAKDISVQRLPFQRKQAFIQKCPLRLGEAGKGPGADSGVPAPWLLAEGIRGTWGSRLLVQGAVWFGLARGGGGILGATREQQAGGHVASVAPVPVTAVTSMQALDPLLAFPLQGPQVGP